MPEMHGKTLLSCCICSALLERRTWRSCQAALAFSAATLVLLIPANLMPFMTTSILGVSRQSHLVSSATAMLQNGLPELAVVIGLFVVILPFARFGLLTAVLGMLQAGRRAPWLGRAFRYANALHTWAMPDVFLIGLAVAYARLESSISAQLGVGAMCFIAAGVLALFVRAALDQHAIWDSILKEPKTDPDHLHLTCHGCEMTLPRNLAGQDCPRCATRLRVRKPEAVGRAVALTLAGALLYVPANIYPIATLPIGFTSENYNVLEGVIDLLHADLYSLALLVLTASFAIPLLKLVGLTWCIVSVLRRSTRHLALKTRVYHGIEEIGRWSMVDPFVIACFVPVTQYNALVYGRAEPAAPAFTAVVILTIIATRCFDPRLMWDVSRPPA